MKKLVLALAVLGLLASVGAAQYHNPIYLFGGYSTTSTSSTYDYRTGLYLGDLNSHSITTLFTRPQVKNYYIYRSFMDANNKDIVFITNSTSSTMYDLKTGIFRYNMTTGQVSTIMQGSYTSPYSPPRPSPYSGLINQDGDYVFSGYSAVTTSPTTRYGYGVFKIDAANNLTTIFDTVHFNVGGPFYSYYGLGRNIDTGKYLVTGSDSSANTMMGYYPILEFEEGNTNWSEWSHSPYPLRGSYYAYGPLWQRYSDGAYVATYSNGICETQKGGHWTTQYYHGYPANPRYSFYSSGYQNRPDLQSAPIFRMCRAAYVYQTFSTNPTTQYLYNPAVAYTEMSPPYVFTGHLYDPNFAPASSLIRSTYFYQYTFEIYQSRNIQTVKTGTGKWDLRLSCPNFPNKRYIGVITAAGVRPGIPLSDGRTIWLNWDVLSAVSYAKLLVPYFDDGPRLLDSKGEAKGKIDVSSFPPLGGLPIWFAMVVLDPSAPNSIAFIPDTYVIRLP